jgi:hypothetical protein
MTYNGLSIYSPESINERIEARLAEAAHDRLLRRVAPSPSPRARLAGALRAAALRLEGHARVLDERRLEIAR